MSSLMSVSLMTRLLVSNPPRKEYLWLTLPLTVHVHSLHLQKCAGLMNQIEFLGICHQSLPGNLITDLQNPHSAPLSHTPYLWSGVEY